MQKPPMLRHGRFLFPENSAQLFQPNRSNGNHPARQPELAEWFFAQPYRFLSPWLCCQGSGGRGSFKVMPDKKEKTDAKASVFGAGDEARTRYLHLGKVALYQMSYTRREHGVLYQIIPICQALIFYFPYFLPRSRNPRRRGRQSNPRHSLPSPHRRAFGSRRSGCTAKDPGAGRPHPHR